MDAAAGIKDVSLPIFTISLVKMVDNTSVKILRALYMNATFRCEVKCFLLDRFPTKYSVVQGCSLSMIMQAIVLNLLLTSLVEGLEGLKITPVFEGMPMR